MPIRQEDGWQRNINGCCSDTPCRKRQLRQLPESSPVSSGGWWSIESLYEKRIKKMFFVYPGERIDREAEAIKENPRFHYEAEKILILEIRQRQLPTIPLICGTQSANIRMVYRRVNRFSIFSSTRVERRCPMNLWGFLKKGAWQEVTTYQWMGNWGWNPSNLFPYI